MPPEMSPPLGAHVSIAGGMPRSIARGEELGCDAIQVFVKNATRWVGRAISDEEVERFRRAHAASPIGPLVAHATYLINLAATDPGTLRRSRTTLGDELDRCERLGIPSLVVHPGAHLETGLEAGLERVAESLRSVMARRAGGKTRVLLETTAGQGTVLGYRLEQLAMIRKLTGPEDRIGLCVDTCHVFAAGYELHRKRQYREFFSQVTALFGSGEPSCLHLNDSRYSLGARRDRHANLGRGEIPVDLFRRLVHDRTLRRTPMLLETPLGEDRDGHRRDLELLRSL